MNIYPDDLEPKYRAHIQHTRDLVPRSPAGLPIGLALTLPGMICALPLTDLWMGFYFLGGVIGFSAGCALGSFLERDSPKLRHAAKVTAEEISMVGRVEPDPLKMEHLGLVFSLITMRPFQDPTVEQSIRSAIREIGSGVANLPGQPAEELLQDAQTFKDEASALAAEAAQESDPVVAASLQRQSAARRQRAAAVSGSSALARRNQTLRYEMSEHITALKTMLDAAALEDRGDGHGLAALTENIQQIAIEARALTEAKQELALALASGQGSRMSVAPEQTQLQGLSG